MDTWEWAEGRRLIGVYLDQIDREISVRFQRTAPPLETTLTQEFLACLDPEASARERLGNPYQTLRDELARSLTDAGLAAPEGAEPWAAEITTIPHPSGYEAFVSHADMGLVIDYSASAGRPTPQPTAFLLQAKKLYPDRDKHHRLVFHGRCRFSGFSDPQHAAILRLQEELEKGALRYLYYMPRRSSFEWLEPAPRRVSHATLAKLHATHSAEAFDDGIWIGGIREGDIAKTAMQVHLRSGVSTLPIRTFILDHMSRAGVFGASDLPDPLVVAEHYAPSLGPLHGLAHGLAIGDEAVVNQVVERLERASVTVPILPATTMRLTIPPPPVPMPSPAAITSRPSI